MRKTLSLLLAATLLAAPLSAMAGSNGDIIVGSIIGGAAGAVIGNSVGGRDGAIVGGALGAAAGVSIATDNRGQSRYRDQGSYSRYDNRYDTRYGNRYDSNYYDNSRSGYDRYSRYDNGYGRGGRVVVVESPRHYYQGNEFVYGVPASNYGRDRGWNRWDHDEDEHYCPPRDVVEVQTSTRYYNDRRGDYRRRHH